MTWYNVHVHHSIHNLITVMWLLHHLKGLTSEHVHSMQTSWLRHFECKQTCTWCMITKLNYTHILMKQTLVQWSKIARPWCVICSVIICDEIRTSKNKKRWKQQPYIYHVGGRNEKTTQLTLYLASHTKIHIVSMVYQTSNTLIQSR